MATLALVVAVVFPGGLVKGVAGFGYAVASTALLATVLDPSRAVVVMILPTLAANVSLVRELDGYSRDTSPRRPVRTAIAAPSDRGVSQFRLSVVQPAWQRAR